MNTLKQILKEFWVPLLLAIIWTVYIMWCKPVNFQSIITAFAPAFFLTSWMTGQFFRIRKQEAVKSGLTTLEDRLISLVDDLETKTKDISNYTTGGNSFCYFGVGVQENNISMWTAVHQGKYPLYNVVARIVDLDEFKWKKNPGNFFAGDKIIIIGDLGKNQAASTTALDLGSGDSRDFNVFFSARNGFFNQPIRFRRVNGKWLKATTVDVISSVPIKNPAYTKVDAGYPLDEKGEPIGI